MKKPAKPSDAPRAVDLIEEAVGLLRAAPAPAWALYLAGAVPWALGLGHFWATTSWFSPRPEEILWRALGLTVLFLWLKTAQAEFCARLRAEQLGVAAEPLSWRGVWRTARRQARVQGWAVPVLPVAAVLTVPLAGAWMYFENATALAAAPDPGGALERRAWREALRWPWPAHLALLLFSGLWACVWLNVGSAFYVLPWLARTLFGLENMFGLSGWSVFNSTFLALVTVLTWLAVDPLVKAYHVLRVFYGEAWHTGEDLRLELRGPPGGRAGRTGRAVLLALGLGLLAGAGGAGGGGVARAAEPGAAAVSPAQVDAALDEALRDRDFLWRLHPLPGPEDKAEADGWAKRFARQGYELVREILRGLRDLVVALGDWIDGLFNKKDKPKETPKDAAPADFGALARALLYGLLGLCLLALLWILWTGWKQRPPPRRTLAPLAAAPLPPDLNDERLEASRLPSDEWLDLARAQMARGEWRLALRALYLASLAGLGAQGLVSLARAKTNLDYERELARRAAGRPEVAAGFRSRRLRFESVWYGRVSAEEAWVRAWLAELEREEGRGV